MTKKDKLIKCRGLLNKEPLTIDDKLWLQNEVFSHHPNIKEKTGSGVSDVFVKKAGIWDNKCFHFLRVDGSIIDISFLNSLKKQNKRQDVIKVFRNIIHPQIKQFRIDNKISDDMVVDHYGIEFKYIVDQFMKDRDYNDLHKKIVSKSDYDNTFSDELILNEFYLFHKQVATLQALTIEEHKTKTYKK